MRRPKKTKSEVKIDLSRVLNEKNSIQNEVEQLMAKKAGLLSSLDGLNASLKVVNEDIKAAEDKKKKAISDHGESMTKIMEEESKLTTDIDSKKAISAELRASIDYLSNNNESLKRDKSSLENDISILDTKKKQLINDCAEITAEINRAKSKIDELGKLQESLITEFKTIEASESDKLDSIVAKRDRAEKEMEITSGIVAINESDIDKLKEEKDDLLSSIVRIKNNITSLKEQEAEWIEKNRIQKENNLVLVRKEIELDEREEKIKKLYKKAGITL